jgi:hypothetical protein
MPIASNLKPIALLLFASLAVAGCHQQPATLVDTTDSPYKVGQVWSYRTRPQEPRATLTVVKVESHPKLGTIVHISLQGLQMKNPRVPGGRSDTVSHLPFAVSALDKSIVKLLHENAPLPEFQGGYKEWRSAFDAGNAGIFTITVAESVDFVETAMNGGPSEVTRKGS